MVEKQHPELLGTLTRRELEILALIQEGLSNAEIAACLVLSRDTVKWYTQQIYSKLGVSSRTRAVARARDLGLLSSESVAPQPALASSLPPENPYKGLHAFREADADDFFGRESFVQRLLARLGETVPLSRFMAVVGPSGSGKSSVVSAGLIPALRQGALLGSERWSILTLIPGARPFEALALVLGPLTPDSRTDEWDTLQHARDTLLNAFRLRVPDPGEPLLIVIDQFEELFSLVSDPDERWQFLDLIYAAVADPHSRVRVVITLRADFFDRPLLHARFGELMRQRTEVVLPLTASEIEQAITRPAARVGVAFESGLVAAMVADVIDQPGALPLLQYALTELFERHPSATLTLDVYRAIGGVAGALGRRAESLFEGLDAATRDQTRQLFLRLVTLGEGVEDTRRRAPLGEVRSLGGNPDSLEDILQTFAAYRLLTLDSDPASRTPTVELAHEALIREWGRLRGWLDNSRVDVRFQRALASAAAEWRASGRHPDFLLRGSRLAQLEEWAASTGLALASEERAYLAASAAERDRQVRTEHTRQARERALERRSRRFRRALLVVLVLATVGAFGLTGVALDQSNIARRNEAEARALYLASAAQLALSEGNLDRAIALAEASRQSVPNPPALAQRVLDEASFAPEARLLFRADNNVGPAALERTGESLEFALVAHIGAQFQFGSVLFRGMDDACAALNVSCRWLSATDFDLDLTRYWNEALQLRPDGIGTTFIDPETIRAGVGQAAELGIPVVVFNVADMSNPETALPGLLYIGSEILGAGQSNARRVLSAAAADGVTIHRGICTNQALDVSWTSAYCAGVKSVFDDAAIPLDVLPITDDPPTAAGELAAFLEQNSDVNAVLVSGPGPAFALYDALRALGRRPGEVYAATRDIHPQVLQMIREGYFLQTIDQQLYIQGYLTVVSLYLYRQYGLRPSGYINTSSVVDASNVDLVADLANAGYR